MEASGELLHAPAPGDEIAGQSPGQQGEGASEGNTHPLTATAQEGLQGLEARTDAIDKMVGPERAPWLLAGWLLAWAQLAAPCALHLHLL
jgi:hypothetical protein